MSTPVPPESPFSRERREAYVRSAQQPATSEAAQPTAHVGTLRAHPFEAYPVLIGLGGLKESGKDTVADILATAADVMKMGMSDVLAAALYVLNPIIEDTNGGRFVRYQGLVDAVGYTEAKTIPEVRRLLQLLGTEVGRNLIHPDVWITATRARIEAEMRRGTSVILTGVRYPNELWLVRDMNGVSVHVSRPDSPFTAEVRAKASKQESHTSETSLAASDFDVTLTNDGSLSDLRVKSLLLLETVLTVRDRRNRS